MTVRVLHLSDYHSHAVPFHARGQSGVGGLARAIAWLGARAGDGRTVVVSGGDMLNAGSPAWSDRYGCADWPWLDGIVSAMALGNHDADYGAEAFARCRASVKFPILCANAVDGAGRAPFAPYTVVTRAGVRIGLLAVAGPDFERLVRPAARPVPGLVFGDRVEAARRAVKALRETERVAAVVLIGHEHHADDLELARAVPGIDLVLGTHSHLELPLEQIAGTSTWTISPGQYLEHVAEVELTFRDGRLAGVEGRLVRMGPELPADPAVAARIGQMQAALEKDPAYAPLFAPLGTLDRELSTEGSLRTTSPLGAFVTDAMRVAARADVAFTTASSLREPLPAGTVTEERLRAALPYPNRVLVYTLTGARLLELVAASAARAGSDLFSQASGVSYRSEAGRPAAVLVGEVPLDPAATYRLALTDFQALVAEPYRSLLAGLTPAETGLSVRDEVRRALGGRPAAAPVRTPAAPRPGS